MDVVGHRSCCWRWWGPAAGRVAERAQGPAGRPERAGPERPAPAARPVRGEAARRARAVERRPARRPRVASSARPSRGPRTSPVSARTRSSDAIIAALDKAGGWGGGRLQIDFSIPLFFGEFVDAATDDQRADAGRLLVLLRRDRLRSGAASRCRSRPTATPRGAPTTPATPAIRRTGRGTATSWWWRPASRSSTSSTTRRQDGSAIDALGAFVWDLTKAYPDNERGDQCTSADAGGFPIAGLLPTADEVAAGAVNHALRFILPNPYMRAKAAYVHPASHAGQPQQQGRERAALRRAASA